MTAQSKFYEFVKINVVSFSLSTTATFVYLMIAHAAKP